MLISSLLFRSVALSRSFTFNAWFDTFLMLKNTTNEMKMMMVMMKKRICDHRHTVNYHSLPLFIFYRFSLDLHIKKNGQNNISFAGSYSWFAFHSFHKMRVCTQLYIVHSVRYIHWFWWHQKTISVIHARTHRLKMKRTAIEKNYYITLCGYFNIPAARKRWCWCWRWWWWWCEYSENREEKINAFCYLWHWWKLAHTPSLSNRRWIKTL